MRGDECFVNHPIGIVFVCGIQKKGKALAIHKTAWQKCHAKYLSHPTTPVTSINGGIRISNPGFDSRSSQVNAQVSDNVSSSKEVPCSLHRKVLNPPPSVCVAFFFLFPWPPTSLPVPPRKERIRHHQWGNESDYPFHAWLPNEGR